jgi:hypothetical protein
MMVIEDSDHDKGTPLLESYRSNKVLNKTPDPLNKSDSSPNLMIDVQTGSAATH